MKRNMRLGLMAIVAVTVLAFAGPASATSSYNSSFRTAYPAAAGSRIDSCSLCHTSAPALNSYGSAYASANHNFTTIASADSDRDTYSNSIEIAAFFFPGNAADHPAPAADATAPTVSVFSIPSTSASLTVPITTLTATDNVGVTGYLVNQSATKPASGAAGWSATKPVSYTFAAAGAQTVYAYAKDLAGNVSNGVAASVTITLPPAPDTTAPTVSGFSIPSTSTSLTVPISGITATDNVGVTGFLVTESATKPAPGAAGWSVSAPTGYTFASASTHTLYAYAKDLAGNVSNGVAASVTITLGPGNGPLFSDSFADATLEGDPNWETAAGKFIGQRGAFAAAGRADNLALVRDVIDLDPYLGGRIETDLRMSDPYVDTRAGIVFDYRDAEHYRYVLFNIKRRTITIGEVNASDEDETDDDDDSTLERTRSVTVRSTAGGWHHLKVDVDSGTGLVSVYLDTATRPAVTLTFASVGQGRVGILASRARLKAVFDNFKVWDASVLP